MRMIVFNGLPSLFTEQQSWLCAALHVWLSAGRRKWLPLIVVMSHRPCCYSVLLHLSVWNKIISLSSSWPQTASHPMYSSINVTPCDWLRLVIQKRLNRTEDISTCGPLHCGSASACCQLHSIYPSLPTANRGQYRRDPFLVPLVPRPPWSCRACLFSQG